MTRKRFIKLLMSRGEQRNRAEAIAFLYNIRNISYLNAYSDYRIKTQIKRSFECLGKVFKGAANNIKSLSNSFDKLSRKNQEASL